MTDDNTRDLTTDEMLRALLADMRDVKARMTALETQGTGTTRPLLDRIIQEVVETREMLLERLAHVETKLDLMAADVMDVRTVQRRLGDRVSEIERRPN